MALSFHVFLIVDFSLISTENIEFFIENLLTNMKWCDIMSVSYISDFVKRCVCNWVIKTFAKYCLLCKFQSFSAMSLCQWCGFFAFLPIDFPTLWVSVSYITTISRINQGIKVPDINVIYSLISSDIRDRQLKFGYNGKCPSKSSHAFLRQLKKRKISVTIESKVTK